MYCISSVWDLDTSSWSDMYKNAPYHDEYKTFPVSTDNCIKQFSNGAVSISR